MFCCKCGNDLRDCTCEDIKERLASLKSSSHILMRWCARCDNHYSQCKCDDPIWTTNDEMNRLKKLTNIKNNGNKTD